MEEINPEGKFYDGKSGASRPIGKYLIFIGIFVLVAALSVYVFTNESNGKTKKPSCGDGTFYGTCSLSKPYYCSDGFLIRDPITCGCPKVLTRKDSVCVGEYFENPREVVLKYVIDGEDKFLNFVLYQDVLDYLDTLPRTIQYSYYETPRRDDFKLMKINDPIQREALMSLVVAIQNAYPNSVVDQARVAISLVQNIPYGEPEFVNVFGKYEVRLSRYPYEVIADNMGSCEGKSELLAFLLRELGYGTSIFYYQDENHEAIGIKCPVEESLKGSGYCFVETTVAAPISYSTGIYLGVEGGRLYSNPQIILLSKGFSLPEKIDEYKDSETIEQSYYKRPFAGFDFFLDRKINSIKEKYGIEEI